MMRYSVVIVVRDQPRQLLGTLLALRKQAQPDEVILVDNASDGDLRGLVGLSQLPITLLRLEQHRSLSGAFNAGIDGASHDFIVAMHGDVRIEHDPADGFAFFANDASIGVAGAKLFPDAPPPSRLLHAGYEVEPLRNWATPIGRSAWDRFTVNREVAAVSDACIFLRRTDLRFDERYWFQLQDIDLCLQYRACGYRVVSLAATHAIHLEDGGLRARRTDPGWAVREIATRWLHHERWCGDLNRLPGEFERAVRGEEAEAFIRQIDEEFLQMASASSWQGTGTLLATANANGNLG